MNQRVLSVSLSHVIRTIATLLLPIAFLSLIAWEPQEVRAEAPPIQYVEQPGFGWGCTTCHFN